MLDALRAKSTFPNLRLVHAPMQRFDLGGDRFGLIFAAFRAFQHLYTVEDQLACLACARRHLAPGGRLAFDVFAPRLARIALAEEPETAELRFAARRRVIVRYATVTRDHPAQLLTVRFRYERSADGRVVANEHATFQMRWFWRFELEHLLARAGFSDVAIYGDFGAARSAPTRPPSWSSLALDARLHEDAAEDCVALTRRTGGSSSSSSGARARVAPPPPVTRRAAREEAAHAAAGVALLDGAQQGRGAELDLEIGGHEELDRAAEGRDVERRHTGREQRRREVESPSRAEPRPAAPRAAATRRVAAIDENIAISRSRWGRSGRASRRSSGSLHRG